MRNRRKLDENNMIWGAEAARILGVSRSTFNNGISVSRYKVDCMRCPMGFKYSIHDVFKIAHPRLNDRQIEEAILDYRLKISEMRKRNRKKRGGKQ